MFARNDQPMEASMSERNREERRPDQSAESDPTRTTPAPSNTQKDPDEWKTGDESMTGAQASYLRTLADEAGEEIDEDLTKAEASKKIDELQEKTGRGRDH
jgi:hypothetical protein